MKKSDIDPRIVSYSVWKDNLIKWANVNNEEVCEICEGKGIIDCEQCDGEGFIECGCCGHTTECKTCYGDGYIWCDCMSDVDFSRAAYNRLLKEQTLKYKDLMEKNNE